MISGQSPSIHHPLCNVDNLNNDTYCKDDDESDIQSAERESLHPEPTTSENITEGGHWPNHEGKQIKFDDGHECLKKDSEVLVPITQEDIQDLNKDEVGQ